MQRGGFQTTVIMALSVVVLAGSGCSRTNAASPHTMPRTSFSPTSLAQSTAPRSVYIGATDGSVSALDAASGAVRWRSVVASSASTTTVAALASGAVYVSAININQHPLTTVLAALRATDGSVLWLKTLAGTAAVVATDPGGVYVALDTGGTTPHEIHMLGTQDGAVLWRTQVEGTGPLHVSLHQGTIYVTSFTSLLPSPGYFFASTMVYALDASTGAVSWRTSIARTNYLASVADGAVYLVDTGTDYVCEPNMLHVLSASDGAERWHGEGSFLRFIGVEQGRAYVASVPEGCAAASYNQVVLYALNANNGSRVWQLDAQSPYGGSLVNGVIYLQVDGDALAAYRAGDGSRLWHVQSESGRLWILDQGLYTSIARQGLDALDPTTGAVRWRYQPGDDVSLSTIANGILYGISSRQIAGSSRSQAVVALRASTGELIWRVQIGTSEDLPMVG